MKILNWNYWGKYVHIADLQRSKIFTALFPVPETYLVTFTEEILNGKLDLLYSIGYVSINAFCSNISKCCQNNFEKNSDEIVEKLFARKHSNLFIRAPCVTVLLFLWDVMKVLKGLLEAFCLILAAPLISCLHNKVQQKTFCLKFV